MNFQRNIYKDDVDFSVLALQDPDFNKQYGRLTLNDRIELMSFPSLKNNGQLDFSNPDAVQ